MIPIIGMILGSIAIVVVGGYAIILLITLFTTMKPLKRLTNGGKMILKNGLWSRVWRKGLQLVGKYMVKIAAFLSILFCIVVMFKLGPLHSIAFILMFWCVYEIGKEQ